jgi:protein-S-isoprenylcysteine O-methyltransferase Ste14
MQQKYGYFRFCAFESLIVLVVINIQHWFHEPFSTRQLISWTIFLIAATLAATGFRLLRKVGLARSRIVEDTQTLVEVGVYRYIRHPLYASLLLFGWGVFFKGPGFMSGLLAIAATIFLIATARCEESFNVDRFGTTYSDYMKKTKMFIPFLL